jgi:hypothetical protein
MCGVLALAPAAGTIMEPVAGAVLLPAAPLVAGDVELEPLGAAAAALAPALDAAAAPVRALFAAPAPAAVPPTAPTGCALELAVIAGNMLLEESSLCWAPPQAATAADTITLVTLNEYDRLGIGIHPLDQQNHVRSPIWGKSEASVLVLVLGASARVRQYRVKRWR